MCIIICSKWYKHATWITIVVLAILALLYWGYLRTQIATQKEPQQTQEEPQDLPDEESVELEVQTDRAPEIKTPQKVVPTQEDQGIVLLKNKDHLLPLAKDFKGTINVCGPNADFYHTSDSAEITPLMGLINMIGKEQLILAQGEPFDYDAKKSVHGLPDRTIPTAVGDVSYSIYFGGKCAVTEKDFILQAAQDVTIGFVCRNKAKTIVVLIQDTPCDMSTFEDVACTILTVKRGDPKIGERLAKVIFGESLATGKVKK